MRREQTRNFCKRQDLENSGADLNMARKKKGHF
jgi:hypothetical protein